MGHPCHPAHGGGEAASGLPVLIPSPCSCSLLVLLHGLVCPAAQAANCVLTAFSGFPALRVLDPDLAAAQIYLNPDNDAVWEEKENADTAESREAVATARSLLSQVRAQKGPFDSPRCNFKG